jgi:hypothetical protein
MKPSMECTAHLMRLDTESLHKHVRKTGKHAAEVATYIANIAINRNLSLLLFEVQ